jgi:hypothetical protein
MTEKPSDVDERRAGRSVQSDDSTQKVDRIDDTAVASHELKPYSRQNKPRVVRFANWYNLKPENRNKLYLK